MPRQLDLTPGNLKVGNNPNVQLAVTGTQITNLFTEFGNLAELTAKAIEAFVEELFGYIDQVTGLNLKALADLFGKLDFSSPEAFVSSLIPFLVGLPEVLVQLLESLIQQLIDPANSALLQNLLEAGIELLVSLPQLVESLFAPLINTFLPFLSGGALTSGSLSDLSSLLGNIPLIGPFLEELTGSALTGGGGQTGFNGFFGDLTGILGLGTSSGLGTGSPILSLVGDIPLFGPLIEEFISMFTGGLSGLSGIGGLTSILGDFMGLFGNPAGLGTGTPTLPDVSSIPIVGPLINEFISMFTGGLGGTSGLTGITGLSSIFDDFLGMLGDPTGLGTGNPLMGELDNIPILGPLIGAFTGSFLGGGAPGSSGAGGTITDLLQAITSIPAELLTGTIGAGLISHAGVGGVSNQTPELLTNPNFDTANSILGQGMWTFDGTQGPAGVSTSVYTTASGTLKELNSNKIAVATGQTLAISGNAKWSGFTGPANSIALTVAKFDVNSTLIGYDTIGSVASPGTSGGWTLLSNPSYTVPSGVVSIQLRPVVTAAATAGTVWFGKLSVKQTGTTLSNPLIGLLDASKIGSGIFPFSMTGVQPLIDTIFGTFTGSSATGNTLTDLTSALGVIPFGNILGIGGPADVGGSIQSTWDNLISGLVGSVGSGAGLSDLFNVTSQVSSNATLGSMGWNILGIRNNKSLKTGFLPSGQSNISLDSLALTATMPTVPITQSTALTNYERIGESIDIGAVSWQGAGVTNITACNVNLYTMDPTTGINTPVHQSANLVGLLSATMSPIIYSLPASVHFNPADIFGMEITVQGTGTHNMAGTISSLPAQAVFPRQWSSVRNSGTSGPPSSFTPSYSSNVGFIEYAVSAGTISLPHNPSTTLYGTPGTQTVPIPSWANFADVIAVGSGGGGMVGGFIINGSGGGAGHWATGTWTRGTDFTGAVSISIVTPAGGARGTSSVTSANGGNATATITGHTVTAAGGTSGDTLNTGVTAGASPGNQTYLGQTYVGGLAQNTAGANGPAPGSGGAGGDDYTAGPGGVGGPGAVWIVFRQT